ncbi:MAG: hypothetical protein LBU57_09225 [Dysgonamonadaceae bacterium]|nr:hypothetical protein [Dysgonamonadaceae bacterium]
MVDFKFDSSEQAIRRKISRLKTDNKIAIIRKDFYVVLPPVEHKGLTLLYRKKDVLDRGLTLKEIKFS